MGPVAFVFTALALAAGLYAYLRMSGKKAVDPEIALRPTTPILGVSARDFGLWAMEPLLQLCQKYRLTPTMLNILGMVFAGFSGLFFFQRWYSWGALWLCLSGVADALDGRLARREQLDSSAGAFLDSVMDRIGESMAFMGMALSSRSSGFQFIILAALSGALMVSYVRAKSEAFGKPIKTGMMQRAERLVLWIVWTLLSPVFVQLTGWSYEVCLGSGFFLMAIGSWWTVGQRIVLVYRALESHVPSA